jgi:hypothetical protein
VNRSATLRGDPAVVRPRWLAHLGLLPLMIGIVAVLVFVRRDDERDLFGPWTGLTGAKGTALIPIGLRAPGRRLP